jgi:mannitol/fructose-specific phosphotransferase system IIA component (Ntr-type)/predicted transcriptional regulator
MELINHLSPEQILLSIEARDKWDVIDQMLDAIVKHPVCKRQNEKVCTQIRQSVIDRERDAATYMGNGIALPHARIRGFRGFAVCIAVLKEEISWDDGDELTKVVFLVLSSEENPTVILKAMSALAHLLSDRTIKRAFLREEDPVALFEYLNEKHISVDVSIVARDIMRTRFPTVRPNTPLRKVTHRMFVNHVEAIAVADEDGRFHGEITCERLLKKGMPDFFNQLMSVSFIKDFDPFEKYFEVEAQSTAMDAATKDCAVANERTTLMEIVYLLAVKKYAKVYVVKKGKLCGTIDRTTVLDQILNL